MAIRDRIHRLRRNQTVQEIADSLGVPVETLLAIQEGTSNSLPPAPGGVNRVVVERLEDVAIPADYAGDAYLKGLEASFTPTPGALVAALWSFQMSAPGTRAWQWFLDINGTARQLTGESGQTNQAPEFQPLHTREMSLPPSGAATLYWRPRVEGELTFKTGVKHNLASTGQTGAATLKNQRIYIWELAPDLG